MNSSFISHFTIELSTSYSQKVKSAWQPDMDCQYKSMRKRDFGQRENSHPASSGKVSMCQQIEQQILVSFTIPSTHCCPKRTNVLVLLRLCHPWTLTSLCPRELQIRCVGMQYGYNTYCHFVVDGVLIHRHLQIIDTGTLSQTAILECLKDAESSGSIARVDLRSKFFDSKCDIA